MYCSVSGQSYELVPPRMRVCFPLGPKGGGGGRKQHSLASEGKEVPNSDDWTLDRGQKVWHSEYSEMWIFSRTFPATRLGIKQRICRPYFTISRDGWFMNCRLILRLFCTQSTPIPLPHKFRNIPQLTHVSNADTDNFTTSLRFGVHPLEGCTYIFAMDK